MDANQTRFHLLLGRDNWSRCQVWEHDLERAGGTLAECWDTSPPYSGECDLHWESERNELTLRSKPFRFRASAGDRRPKLGRADASATSDRRGAARDRFGNWYYISKDRRAILVHSVGCKHTTSFWSSGQGQIDELAKDGLFQPAQRLPPAATSAALSGLAVTEDHFLVAGTLGPNESGGLLIFDLHAGGPPRELCWPDGIAFQPFDMAPRRQGGVWILDRMNRCYWALDRHLRVISRERSESPPPGEEQEAFQPSEGAPNHSALTPSFAVGIFRDAASPLEAADPVSIEGLPDGTVLILDAVSEGNPSEIWHYDFGTMLNRVVLSDPVTAVLEEPEPRRYFHPAFDFVFLAANEQALPGSPCACGRGQSAPKANTAEEEKLGDLFVVTSEGNQTIRFRVIGPTNRLHLEGVLDFYPMRLFGGNGLVGAGTQVFYDMNDRWVPLVQQHRPLYVEEAVIVSPYLDGREPGCIWHRVILEGCLPPETCVAVSSRASDEKDELQRVEWKSEPAFYQRANGSELPFMARSRAGEAGTFELLFQRAHGRYVQLKLTVSGNGRSTPRLNALRVYYPRFSYLEHYLPAVYREDRESASFLDRFLANVEGTNTALEDKIAAVQMLFDVRSAPAETLEWLASWFGIVLDPAWDQLRQRLLIRHAMDFFQWRGTVRGLQMVLHLAFDDCPSDSIFDPPASRGGCGSTAGARTPLKKYRGGADRFRIVEKFLLRRGPAVTFGAAQDDGGPRFVKRTGRWTPDKGLHDLRLRFEMSTGKRWGDFDLDEGQSAEETQARLAFARRELGFEPSDVMEDQLGWRNFLRARYSRSIEDLRSAHEVTWSDFEQIPMPSDMPAAGQMLADWREYLSSTEPMPYEVKRRLWQDFLARRYSTVTSLNEKYATQWRSFELIGYPTALRGNQWLLSDWFQFESLVLPTHAAAHRFTVMLPFTGHTLPELEQRSHNLEMARRLLHLEKPAHTVFEIRFYWGLFRLGEARLGLDTVLGLGGRDPALLAQAVLGQTFLAEARLAANHPFDVTDRQIVGRDRLN